MNVIKSVHTSNIANVAYGNCKILKQFAHDVKLYCHDMTHVMSQPEWDDLDLETTDFPDEDNFYSHTADLGDYRRPEWFFSGSIYSFLVPSTDQTQIEEKPSFIFRVRCWAIRLFDSVLLKILPRLRKLPPVAKSALKGRYYKIFNVFSHQFTDHQDNIIEYSNIYGDGWKLEKSDCTDYQACVQWIEKASCGSDVIYAYVLSPIYAMLYGKKPYIAIEIGTMRDIPFEGTSRGRLLAMAYRMADFVLITNPDVKKQAEQLGIKKYAFCPHPVDEEIYAPVEGHERAALRKKLFDIDGTTLVMFAPARQNWEVKGNNKYFEAFSQCIKKGMDVKLVIAGWGQEIGRSKQYCNDLGIEKHVQWVKPVTERGLVKFFSAADIVLDQYELGVFGLITPKAMSCGAVVITSYDPEINQWCFTEHPPLLCAKTATEIFSHIQQCYNDRVLLHKYSAKSRAWVLKEHSKARVEEILSFAAKEAVSPQKKLFRKKKLRRGL